MFRPAEKALLALTARHWCLDIISILFYVDHQLVRMMTSCLENAAFASVFERDIMKPSSARWRWK